MGTLYGLDCTYPDCVHDTVRGYRMFFRLRVAARTPLFDEALFGANHVRAPESDKQALFERLRGSFVNERPAVVFRPEQRAAMLEQVDLLGGDAEAARKGLTGQRASAQLVRRHATLPEGFDARLLVMQETPLPRIALYFRWQPMAGDMLTPEKVFQCVFLPDASMAERTRAPERRLTEEEFLYVRRMRVDGEIPTVTRESLISCQHCHRPLPLRAFNTLTLRECFKGE